MRNKITTILFVLMLAAGLAAHFCTPDRAYSKNEKRLLAGVPKVSAKRIRSGAFGDDIEKYLADQFPLRDSFVSVKTVTERLLGKRESGGAYFADDGYLMEVRVAFDEDQIAKNVKALLKLQSQAEELNIPFRVMLVPTAADILSQKLPKFAPNADQQAVLTYAKEQGLKLIDVTEALKAHKDEYIYYRTDHHWTSLGAYYAYAAWMQDKGETPAPLSAFKKETLCTDFRGTTYAKVNYPFAAYDTIDAYSRADSHHVDYNQGYYVTETIYERKYLEEDNPYAVFFNSNQSVTVAQAGGQGKLLIVKDSYANCFAQFPLDDYEEVHMIDLRFFAHPLSEYIGENGITEVLVLYNIPNFSEDRNIRIK